MEDGRPLRRAIFPQRPEWFGRLGRVGRMRKTIAYTLAAVIGAATATTIDRELIRATPTTEWPVEQGRIDAGDYYLVSTLPCDGPALSYYVVHVDAMAASQHHAPQMIYKTAPGLRHDVPHRSREVVCIK